MKKIILTLVACFIVNAIIAQNWNPRHPSWTDSFEANGFCWCNSTNFDHNLDTKTLRLNGTNYNIVDVCDELEKHPLYRNFQNGDAPYNDIQCGNGPANDAADETGCPGRTDLGPNGCDNIGPKFDTAWLESRSRFGGDTTPPPSSDNPVVHIRKRNATSFAIDGNHGGTNGQNIYLWSENESNQNQQWIEIDRGGGYYSYQKMGTNFCIDGNRGGENGQNVYLWGCNANNQNQHWQKVNAGGGAVRLVKRNAPGFALDGGNNGENRQNISLYDSSNSSQNLQWIITPINEASLKLQEITDSQEIVLYPNPVTSTATIVGAVNETVHVYDMNGKTMLTKTITSENETLDLSALAPGVYYARAIGLEKKSVMKIIKQ